MDKGTKKRWLFKDILRDRNSSKYSFTKFASLVLLVLIIIITFVAIKIMLKNDEIDNFFIGEILGLLLTLLGYKNLKRQEGNGNHDDTPT